MKLRKLTIALLLIAAQLHAFAQSADIASAQNNFAYAPARAAEPFDSKVQVPSVDTTKQGANQASKNNNDNSKKVVATSTKTTVDKPKTAANTPVTTPVDNAKTVNPTPKTQDKSGQKPVMVAVKNGIDSSKKMGTVAAKNTADNASKMVNTSPKVITETPKKTGNQTAETPKKVNVPIFETPQKAATETPKSTAKDVVKDNKTTPSVSTTKNNSNTIVETATVRNASILNGDKDDFSPTFFENGLLYCSNSKKLAKATDKSTVVDDLNLKFAVLDSLGSLAKPSAFSRRTNSKTHEGPSCFSSKGDTMFLTRVMSKGGIAKYTRDGETTLKIYIKVRDAEGNYMGDAVLPFESENFSYCHPTLSADGQRLYFASNMPGGFGGMDLWMSRKMKTGEWSKAMNLGSRINTSGNELFPYYGENGVLYFSSTGAKKIKEEKKPDLNIFRVDIESKIALPTAMPEGFNTEGDDFGIMFLPKNPKKGYFSSNRKGGSGGDDIYEFEIK